MNSIVLMAEVLTDPELRRTPDNQSSIASFLVQFAGGRTEEAPRCVHLQTVQEMRRSSFDYREYDVALDR